MNVNSVGDDFGIKSIVRQNHAQNSRLPLMQRPHGVEGMGGNHGAVIHSGSRLLCGCIRVSNGDLDSQCSGLPGNPEIIVHLGSESDFPDCVSGKLNQPAEGLKVCPPYVARIVGTSARGIQVGALQVNPKSPCSVHSLAIGGKAAQRNLKVGIRSAESSGEKRCSPMTGE